MNKRFYSQRLSFILFLFTNVKTFFQKNHLFNVTIIFGQNGYIDTIKLLRKKKAARRKKNVSADWLSANDGNHVSSQVQL